MRTVGGMGGREPLARLVLGMDVDGPFSLVCWPVEMGKQWWKEDSCDPNSYGVFCLDQLFYQGRTY